MEVKKSKKANLERKKGLFLQIGFIITLALVFFAFEYSVSELNTSNLGELADLEGEEEMMPITRKEEIKPPEVAPPKKVAEVLNIVEDNIEIEDEFKIEDFDVDQDETIVITEYAEEEEEEEQIFYIVEDMPTFMEGNQENSLSVFRNWIGNNLKYPPIAMENGVEGTVHVSFVVSTSGKVANVQILRPVDPALDAEAKRVLLSSPTWTPGKQRGKAVRVAMSIPIKFVLQ